MAESSVPLDAAPPRDRILVAIPAYRCEKQIGRVLGQLASPAVRDLFETVLVIDNQSPDDTAVAALRALHEHGLTNALVARNRENYGLGGSHKAVFAYAERQGYTHVVVLHGDDQGHIADLVPILEQGLHRSHDACLGSRFTKGSGLQGYSAFRIFGNRVFNVLFSIGTRKPVTDLGSGLNIFARALFVDERIRRYSDDLRFNVFLLLGAIDEHAKIMFFPITWREDDQVSNVKMASQAAKTLQILRDYVLRRAWFRTADHRETLRSEYRFDVIAPAESGV